MRGALIRLGIFLAVSALLGTMIVGTLLGEHTGTTDSYHAVFADVSGLRSGDPVRVSGVKVGQVTSTELKDATRVDVTFTANHNQRVTTTTHAVVRYANLLGQRFLALTQGDAGGTAGSGDTAGTVLKPGSTIPLNRTAPALSLTALFNGFRPLFNALNPTQVNELSTQIVQVLQGEGGTVDDLLTRTADLVTNLADRDKLFLDIIDGLSAVLQVVSKHDTQLGSMLVSLHQLTAGLAKDTTAIGNSLDGVDALMSSVDTLLKGLQQHSFEADVQNLQSVTGVFAGNQDLLDKLVKGFPIAFGDFSRITQNGNWVNAYLCGTIVKTTGTAKLDLKQLGQLGNLPPSILALLKLLPLSAPVDLKVPAGSVGSSTAPTGVCR